MTSTGRRRAVVTGGAGFLGSHLCESLLASNYHVLCLDNFVTGVPANVAHLMENTSFRLVRTDVTDYVHVGGHVDAVLHFASPASPIDYLELPIHTLKVGSIGTLHALGLAREKGGSFPARVDVGNLRGTRSCIRSRSRTGATSIPSVREVCTTRPSALPRR